MIVGAAPAMLLRKRSTPDPYWADVVALFNFNNTITDSSPTSVSLTNHGSTGFTTDATFGGKVLGLLDGSTNYLSGSAAATALGSGDGTIEVAFYSSANGESSGSYIFSTDSSTSSGSIQIAYNNGTRNAVLLSNGSVLANPGSPSATMNSGAWNMLVYTRASGTYHFWLNGTSIASGSDSTNYSKNGIYIGGLGSSNNYAQGYVGAVRITKGVARSVTTPTYAYFPTS